MLNEWIGAATSANGEVPGNAHLREMLAVLGLHSLLAADEQAPEQVTIWPSSVSKRAVSVTSRLPTVCAMRSRRKAGRSAMGRAALS